jgi:hypothetical protein
MLRFDQENAVSISLVELLRLSFIFKDVFLSLLFFAGAYETTRIHLSLLENAVCRESFYTGTKKLLGELHALWGNYTCTIYVFAIATPFPLGIKCAIWAVCIISLLASIKNLLS